MVTVAEAEKLLISENMTQKEIDTVFANIETAIAGLVAIESEHEPKQEEYGEGLEEEFNDLV